MAGGLGIRNIRCVNQALLGKQAWKIIHDPDSLISRVIGAKYNLNADNYENVMRTPVDNSSWGWKGIVWGLALVAKELCWKVGRPSLIRTWECKWVDGVIPQKRVVVDAPPGFENCGDYVSDLITRDSQWDLSLINSLMDNHWTDKIIAIPVPTRNIKDKLYWHGSTSGDYCVKKSYQIALQALFEETATPRDRNRREEYHHAVNKVKIWHLPGPNKWKVFLWKILTNTLPVGKELGRRGFRADVHCQVCGNEDTIETQEHLFRDCPVSERFWSGSILGIRSAVTHPCSLRTWIINWLTLLTKKDNSSNATIDFLAALWTIWCNRNDMIFRTGNLMYEKLFSFHSAASAIAKQGEAQRGRERITEITNEMANDLRQYLPFALIGEVDGCLTTRFRVDAAWNNDGRAGFGWVMLNNNGSVSREGNKRGRAQTALQAETLAILETLKWARRRGLLHVWIMSDCLQAILQLANVSKGDHHVTSVLEDIQLLATNFHCCLFSYIPRSINRSAHELARKAKSL